MGTVSAREFFGGSVDPTVFSGGIVTFGSPGPFQVDLRWRFWRISATSAGLFVRLPSKTIPGLPLGAPLLFIANVGSNTFSVRDLDNENLILNVAANRVAIVSTLIISGGIRFIYEARNYSSY